MPCENCIHDSMCGCVMVDCIHHPKTEEYSAKMSTNTFVDRFVDRNAGSWVDTNKTIKKKGGALCLK